jgi:hypothetical protein
MTKTTPLALIVLLAFSAAASAQVARKAVPVDNRINDASVEFDDAKYPKGPVSELTFWGFGMAKSDYNDEEDRLCDLDVAELASNAAQAARRAGAKNGEVTVAKQTIIVESERCDDTEIPKGHLETRDCWKIPVRYCGARITVSSKSLKLQYKSIPQNGTDKACREALVQEMTKSAVIDSAIVPTYEGATNKSGCAMKALELVETK